MLGLSGYCTVTEAFSAGFGHNIVLIIFITLILSVFFEESGFSAYLADRFLSLKISVGRPWVFTTIFLMTSYVSCLFVGAFAAPIILWGVFYQLCHRVGFKSGDKYVSCIIFGTVLASLASMCIFPWRVLAMMVVGMAGVQVPNLQYFLIQTTLSLCLVLGYILLCKYVVRPNVEPLQNKQDYYANLRGQKPTTKQAFGGIVMIIFIVMMFVPSVLPKEWLITSIMNNIGVVGSAGILLVILAIIRKKDGDSLINIRNYIQKGSAWDLIFLMAATFPVAAAMESEKTGIVSCVVNMVTENFMGLNPYVFLIIIIVFLAALSQVAHNLILLIVFTPLVSKLCVAYGLNPAIFAMLVLLACQIALSTPAASANAAMIFGNEWMNKKHAYQLGIMVFFLNIFILICIGLPMCLALFG